MRLHLKMKLTCHLELEGFSCYFFDNRQRFFSSCLNEFLSLAKTHIPLPMANIRWFTFLSSEYEATLFLVSVKVDVVPVQSVFQVLRQELGDLVCAGSVVNEDDFVQQLRRRRVDHGPHRPHQGWHGRGLVTNAIPFCFLLFKINVLQKMVCFFYKHTI